MYVIGKNKPKPKPKLIMGLPNGTNKNDDQYEIIILDNCQAHESINFVDNYDSQDVKERSKDSNLVCSEEKDKIESNKFELSTLQVDDEQPILTNEINTIIVTNIAISNKFAVLNDTKDTDMSEQNEFTNNKGISKSNNINLMKPNDKQTRRSSRNKMPNRKYNTDYICDERILDFRLTPTSKKKISSVTNLNLKPTIVLDKIKENDALEKEKIRSLIIENTTYFYKIQIMRGDFYYRHNDYWNLFKHEMFPIPTFYEFHKLCLDHWITTTHK